MKKHKAATVRAYLGIGSNRGDRMENIEKAVELMKNTEGIIVSCVSSIEETEPVGGPPQGKYLNAAAGIVTSYSPSGLLGRLMEIESVLGRRRSVRWGPRVIDLDVLLYGEEIIQEKNLVIPHPRMHERGFVLRPLCEIAPEALHPKFAATVSDLLIRHEKKREC